MVVFNVVVRAQEAISFVKPVVSISPIINLRWCFCCGKRREFRSLLELLANCDRGDLSVL